MNGWDIGKLKENLQTCTNPKNLENCPQKNMQSKAEKLNAKSFVDKRLFKFQENGDGKLMNSLPGCVVMGDPLGKIHDHHNCDKPHPPIPK